MLLALVLLVSAEENLKDAYQRLTAEQTSLTFSTYSAGRNGHRANAHLIVSNDGAVLVDVQATPGDAKRLVDMVKASGVSLQFVVLTSAAPDQAAGLDVIREAFPSAKIVSTKAIAAALKITEAAKIEIAGHPFPLVPLTFGKDKVCAALDVRPLKMIVGGCTVSGDHALADVDAAQAKSAIATLRALQAKTLLPSYGSSGPAAQILDAMAAKIP